MSVTLQGDMPLTQEEAQQLWEEAAGLRKYAGVHDAVTVRSVNAAEIHELNRRYRGKDRPTNVLTFSYPAGADVAMLPAEELITEHDIVVCPEVGEAEAQERGAAWRDYAALLVVHAFLHAMGLDHEVSPKAAHDMAALEREILQRAGFAAGNL